MAKSRTDFITESLILRFLTAPLRWLKVLAFVILIVFGSSMILQTWFHQPSLLQQETAMTQQLGRQSLWAEFNSQTAENKPGINIQAARYAYSAFSTVFFEWSQINRALNSNLPGDFGYGIGQTLKAHIGYLQRFDDTLKIIAVRLGNAALFALFALFLTLLGLIDGLVQRRIRQENAGRESAGLYHRAKYWRSGIAWSSLLVYLCLPVAVSPLWLTLPAIAAAVMTFLQAKYLKKYL